MYRYPVEGHVVSSDQTSKLHVDILTIFIEYPKNTTLAQKGNSVHILFLR